MGQMRNHRIELAQAAIQRVVSVFCSRCAAAADALDANNLDKFDEYFQLQRMAWVNLDAMLGKYESELMPGEDARKSIRAWMIPCQQAAAGLQAKISKKLVELEGQGRSVGRLKTRLAAFQSAAREPGLFAKGA